MQPQDSAAAVTPHAVHRPFLVRNGTWVSGDRVSGEDSLPRAATSSLPVEMAFVRHCNLNSAAVDFDIPFMPL